MPDGNEELPIESNSQSPSETVPIYTPEDFEVDAFKILQDSTDYDKGVAELTSLYDSTNDKEKARSILSTYSDDLYYKNKGQPFTLDEVLKIAPYKPSEVAGETDEEKINNWQTANKEFFKTSADPDQIAASQIVSKQIDNYASEMRRDTLSNTEDGLWAWSKDKTLRLAEGVVNPLSRLAGYKEPGEYLHERTARKRDEDLSSAFAGAIGSVGAALGAGAVTGGIGTFITLAAEGAGSVRASYEDSLAATHDPERAIKAASFDVAAQAVQMIPVGRGITKVTESLSKKTLTQALGEALEAQTVSYGNVARATLEGGLAGTTSNTLAHIGQNIGLDQNGDITAGGLNAFLVNGTLVGGLHGAHALVENAALYHAKELLKKADTELSKPTAKPPYGEKPTTEESPEYTVGSEETSVTAPKFVKDADDYWVEEQIPVQTVEERIALTKQNTDAYNDYVNEEPVSPAGKWTKETGEEVIPPLTEPDVEVPDIPTNAVLLGEGGAEGTGKVNRLITYVFSKLGGTLQERRNILNGAFASYTPGKTTIKVLRSLGADPLHLQKTLAHEFTHFLDGVLNGAYERGGKLQNIVDKLRGLKAISDETIGSDRELNLDARELSTRWRPGWNGLEAPEKIETTADKFQAYRANPKEIFADVGSAIINDPEWVKTVDNGKFKRLYDAFEKRLKENASLNEFWGKLREFETDPDAVTKFNLDVTNVGRKRQGDIAAKVAQKKIDRQGFKGQLKSSLSDAFQYFVKKTSIARNAAIKLDRAGTAVAMDLLNDIQRTGSLGDYLHRVVDGPVNTLLSKVQQAGIEPNTWAHYEWANHVENDVTNTMDNIQNNPKLYRRAATVIRYLLLEDPSTPKDQINNILSYTNLRTSKDISDALAQINLIGDISHLSLDNYLNKYDVKDPDRNSKALRDYNREVKSLNKRKQSIPIENLRKKINELPVDKGRGAVFPEIKEALQDIVSPNAFAARRYLLNAGGATVYDAANDLAGIKRVIGLEKWAALEKISKEFHDTLNQTHELIEKSGIFSPELLRRIKNNDSNYVTTNVLKYFEGDESISASVRSAIGSLSETGNEIASTVLKTSAIAARSYRQIGLNSAVKLAELIPGVASKVKLKPGENIFDLKEKLSKEDPDNSYIISYKEGKPELNKLEGKSWEKMFTSVSKTGLPLVNTFLDLSEKFNNIFRTKLFKTAFSPAFALTQKYYDRANEAIMANSMEFNFGLPVHSSGKLRANDTASKQEITHFQKTGELTGDLKKVIDLDGAALHLSSLEAEGYDPFQSISSAIYEAFGTKMPNEKSNLEKIGIGVEKKLGQIGFDYFRHMAEFDELRTKLNGFKIGKSLGMTDAAAAVFARENFGIPDPRGGGVAAPLINKMFLFGAAHLGGLYHLGILVKDMPKTAATQAVRRIILPKLILSAAVMSAVLRRFSSDEDAEKYKLLYGMIGSNEKISKNALLFGAQDGAGNFHNFFDIKLADIKPDWKPWYARLPQDREITTATKVLWPLIDGLSEGDVSKGFTGALKGGASATGGSFQPLYQYAYNLGQMIFGENPTDFYRQKGIFTPDVAEAGSVAEKVGAYAKYAGAQQFPPILPYNPFDTGEGPSNIGETTIKSIPVVGPMVRALVGVGSYGLIEQSKEKEAAKTLLKAEIRLSTDDTTKELLSMHRSAQAQLTSAGKEGRKALGVVGEKDRYLTSWYSREWQHYEQELEAARAASDSERYSYILRELENSSKAVKSRVSSLKSGFQDNN